MNVRARVMSEIIIERERQIELGYTPEHDAEHGFGHLIDWVENYLESAKVEWSFYENDEDRQRVTRRLVQAAALLMAAIELNGGLMDDEEQGE